MASSSSNSSCFQCHDSTSNCFRNGWRLRNGELAHLCYRCACVYEDGRFCETFHANDGGWRDCESCGKLVHCGCVVSFNQCYLLDSGGVICRECSKKSLILALEFQTDPVDVQDLGNKVQIEPYCWPAGIDSGVQQSPMAPKSVLNPLFEKILSASDADIRLGRIVIPKKYAKIFFPEVTDSKGLMMNILDMENKTWEFTFRYWSNCGNRTYVLEGVRDFLALKKLQAGDTVTFYRAEPGGNLAIEMRKTSVVKPPHQYKMEENTTEVEGERENVESTDQDMKLVSKTFESPSKGKKPKITMAYTRKSPRKSMKSKPKINYQEVESDDDFQTAQSQKRKEKLNKSIQKFVEFNKKRRIRTRNPPVGLYYLFKQLNDAQLTVLEKIGFGSTTFLKVKSVPTRLAYWLISNYDPSCNKLNLGSHEIEITTQLVHEVFGIPMGKLEVKYVPKPSNKYEQIDNWKRQFGDQADGLISLEAVVDKIVSTGDSGRSFELNFLVAYNTIMALGPQSGTVNMQFLTSLTAEADIKMFDWCSYIIACLNYTTKRWKGTTHFNGPHMFLTLLYAHDTYQRTNPAQKRIPAIAYNNTESLKNLENSLAGEGNDKKGKKLLDAKDDKKGMKRKRGGIKKIKKSDPKNTKKEDEVDKKKKLKETRNHQREFEKNSETAKSETKTVQPTNPKEWAEIIKQKIKKIDEFVNGVQLLITKACIESKDHEDIYVLHETVSEWESRLPKQDVKSTSLGNDGQDQSFQKEDENEKGNDAEIEDTKKEENMQLIPYTPNHPWLL